MKLYHTGRIEIREPDVHHGRRNADFGPGFYLTPDLDFAMRWVKAESIINEYELDETGLTIYRFQRNEEWFHYIFNNRNYQDGLDADVIIGPIANDIIFETYGIISSGYLKTEDAMKLLLIGPEFTQVAIKSEKAISQLRWLGSQKVDRLDASQRQSEREAYSRELEKVLQTINIDD
jgi:hypothetical protein